MDAYASFRLDWDTYYNNEPFLSAWMRIDVEAVSVEAGFDRDKYVHVAAPDLGSVPEKDFDRFAKADTVPTDTQGYWGEVVMWNMYCAWK